MRLLDCYIQSIHLPSISTCIFNGSDALNTRALVSSATIVLVFGATINSVDVASLKQVLEIVNEIESHAIQVHKYLESAHRIQT